MGSISAIGCAGLNLLVVVDVDLDDLPGDTRADLVEIAVDLGVVCVLGEGGAPVEDTRPDDKEDDDSDDDELAAGLFRRSVIFLWLVRVGPVGLSPFCLIWTVPLIWRSGVSWLICLLWQGYFPPR